MLILSCFISGQLEKKEKEKNEEEEQEKKGFFSSQSKYVSGYLD